MATPDDGEWRLDPDDELIAGFVANAAGASPGHLAWTDQRFLDWLRAEASHENGDLAAAGRAMLSRAYCRRLGIRRLSHAPTIVEIADCPSDSPTVAVMPWTDVAAGVSPDGRRVISVPEDIAANAWIASRAPACVDSFAPFIHDGDIVILGRPIHALNVGAFIAAQAGHVRITSSATDAGVIGGIIAIWCEH